MMGANKFNAAAEAALGLGVMVVAALGIAGYGVSRFDDKDSFNPITERTVASRGFKKPAFENSKEWDEFEKKGTLTAQQQEELIAACAEAVRRHAQTGKIQIVELPFRPADAKAIAAPARAPEVK